MEKISTVVYGVVCLVVMVLLVATVAIPVIEDSQYSVTEKMQNTGERYTISGIESSLTLEKVDGVFAINGVSPDDILTEATGSIYLIWDMGSILYSKVDNVWNSLLTVYAYDSDSGIINNQYIKKVVFDSGNITLTTSAESTIETKYNWLMIPDVDGEYGSYTLSSIASGNVFVDSDSKIYVYDEYWVQALLIATGTIDSLSVGIAFNNNEVVTSSVSVTVNSEKTDYGLSNKLNSITISGPIDQRGTQVFVPLEYTGIEKSDSPIYVILGILPILMIITIIVTATSMIVVGRD